jgi:sugar phosphate isomerase/epimerase
MKNNFAAQRLAVCSWSLRPANPKALIEQLQATGLRRVQLALDPLREAPGIWGEAPLLLRQADVTIVSGMMACVGEDYSTLETIRATGGITPDATWELNWKNIRANAALAQKLGLKLVTFHAGFLPHGEADPDYQKLRQRMEQIADLFASHQIALALETGQETAATLRDFLQQLGRANVGVNFDPANMILYGKGDPIEALRVLGPWIRQVHIKDARHTKIPGTWGAEVVAGTGDVNWQEFFATLHTVKFTGDCCIEREAGEQRVADIRAARECIEEIIV